MKIVYVLTRGDLLLGVYEHLEKAKEVFPGKWAEVYNGPIRTVEEWTLGEARIREAGIR